MDYEFRFKMPKDLRAAPQPLRIGSNDNPRALAFSPTLRTLALSMSEAPTIHVIENAPTTPLQAAVSSWRQPRMLMLSGAGAVLIILGGWLTFRPVAQAPSAQIIASSSATPASVARLSDAQVRAVLRPAAVPAPTALPQAPVMVTLGGEASSSVPVPQAAAPIQAAAIVPAPAMPVAPAQAHAGAMVTLAPSSPAVAAPAPSPASMPTPAQSAAPASTPVAAPPKVSSIPAQQVVSAQAAPAASLAPARTPAVLPPAASSQVAAAPQAVDTLEPKGHTRHRRSRKLQADVVDASAKPTPGKKIETQDVSRAATAAAAVPAPVAAPASAATEPVEQGHFLTRKQDADPVQPDDRHRIF